MTILDDLTSARYTEMHTRIAAYVRRTPVLRTQGREFDLGDFPLTFKLEFLQHAGSFKTRGAFANLLTHRPKNVVAASGGNHGAAVAYAAQQLGIPAEIFVPEVSSPAKIARIRAFGANIHVGGERYADALAASEEWIANEGGHAVHAYDALETLLGAGTTAIEFAQDAPELDTLFVAVGGGGLIGGIAGYLRDRVRVVAVEPLASPTLARALEAGHPVDAPAGGIAADSLAPRQVGALTFPVAQAFVDRVVLVEDEAIVAAQRLLWERLRVVTEPGGAAAFAALLAGGYVPEPGERVGVLLCGANTQAVSFD